MLCWQIICWPGRAGLIACADRLCMRKAAQGHCSMLNVILASAGLTSWRRGEAAEGHRFWHRAAAEEEVERTCWHLTCAHIPGSVQWSRNHVF